uniref:DUF885 domain-containing protein n=1 Tax=Steinernema glaseri TaxID=37863 RepID=A0A1I7YB18_9BILA
DEPFEQEQLNRYLQRMLEDDAARADWGRNGLAFADTADLYSMPQHAADRLWAGRDAFDAVEALQGEVYRELEGRRTLRTEVEGNGYFVKIHRGIGWGEIFKNLFTAKLPVLGAGQEWQAIQ